MRRSSRKSRSYPVVPRMGEHTKEALENVEIVINEWIETAKELGGAIPKPKGRLIYA